MLVDGHLIALTEDNGDVDDEEHQVREVTLAVEDGHDQSAAEILGVCARVFGAALVGRLLSVCQRRVSVAGSRSKQVRHQTRPVRFACILGAYWV